MFSGKDDIEVNRTFIEPLITVYPLGVRRKGPDILKKWKIETDDFEMRSRLSCHGDLSVDLKKSQ